ncbi:MAG TPA: HAD family hydrolase [Gemmatimonadaceae bacterium]|nr:HAD family hydrolase [Gemmatimonadaceae bacterium]
MRLVLFDIDGTLLWSDGTGRRAMEGALVETFGTTGAPEYRYDGKTDRQIVRELMRGHGHEDAHIDARLEALLDSYLTRLERELEEGTRRPALCAGVTELLEELEARRDVTLGLLTGNLERGAALKLASVGIDIARFRVNAFGSDEEHRPLLPAVAQRRARDLLGLDVRGDRIVIVGDTPADIDCGRSIGARAVAVATGRYSIEDLAAHAPAALFPNLSDTDAVVRAILTV